MSTTERTAPDRDPSDAAGDSGDQAQDLRFALEQEAIAAAIAGHPRGNADLERGADVVDLEGDDPLDGPNEGDASDDPIHGGSDITGREPEPISIEVDDSYQGEPQSDDEAEPPSE